MRRLSRLDRLAGSTAEMSVRSLPEENFVCVSTGKAMIAYPIQSWSALIGRDCSFQQTSRCLVDLILITCFFFLLFSFIVLNFSWSETPPLYLSQVALRTDSYFCSFFFLSARNVLVLFSCESFPEFDFHSYLLETICMLWYKLLCPTTNCWGDTVKLTQDRRATRRKRERRRYSNV